MASDRRLGRIAALLGVLLLGCSGGDDLVTDPSVGEVPALSLEVLGQHAVRLTWTAAATTSVRLERRVNLQGEFAALTGDLPRAQHAYVDSGLEPSTFYGYRLVGYDAFGNLAGTSAVVGGRTAPPPALEVSVTTEPPTAPSVDADGYTLTLAGPSDTTTMPIEPTSTQLFSPLAPGRYQVTVDGVAPQCAAADSLSRTADITDEGTSTVQQVAIAIQCRDPERGRVTAVVTTSGELPDADGFTVELAGLADDTSLPDSDRAYLLAKPVAGAGGSVTFDDLRAGSYVFTVTGLAPNCSLEGPPPAQFAVAVLDDLSQPFAITCPDPAAAGRPFVLKAEWSPAAASTGTPVGLDLVLDLSARPAQVVVAYESQIRTATEVLRFDSASAGDLPNVVANEPQPGLALVSGLVTGDGLTGVVRLARVWYTVVGADGETATTQTAHASTYDGAAFLDDSIRVVEGTFTVGAGGGPVNQAPQAQANGPYAGDAGVEVAFSAAGSSDPDGSIASYAWAFGDGATGTGESVTHGYPTAGSYTATLTVTDDLGLTASATANVTIAGGGGGGENQAPVAQANGPYTAAIGADLALSAAGSSDPDGSIASYSWAFGDGATGTGASVSHAYATAGTYTATLTVTDDLGLTATATAQVTITDGGGGGDNQPPVAQANGPYTAAAGADVALSAAGSSDPDGSIASYAWAFGDGATGTGESVTHAYATAGTYTATLTVTDDLGLTATATAEVTITGGGGGDGPLDWQASFGPVDPETHEVVLTLALDLSSDPAAALTSWQVTSLHWDPAVLSYASIDFAGGNGSVIPTHALEGTLELSGTPGTFSGLVTVAQVRFIAYGASGTTSSATVTLGALAGTSSGAAVDLSPRVVIHDAEFTTP